MNDQDAHPATLERTLGLKDLTLLYRRRSSESKSAYRVPDYPLTPLLFIAAAVALVLNTIVAQSARAAIGLAIVLLGAPAYLLWNRSQARQPDE